MIATPPMTADVTLPGRRVRVAGLSGVVRCRYLLTIRPKWVVVLDGGWGTVIVGDDEIEDER